MFCCYFPQKNNNTGSWVTEVFFIFSIAIRYDSKRAGCLLSQNVRFPLCQPWTWARLLIRGVWVAGLLLYISHVPPSLLSPLSDSNPSVLRDRDRLMKSCEVQAMSSVIASFCCLELPRNPSRTLTFVVRHSVEVPIDESVLIYLSFTLSKLQACFSGEVLITSNSNYSTSYLIFVLLSTITIPRLKS